MPERRRFPTLAVLSAVYGTLLCEIREVYRVLNFLTQDNLFTHQLPRAARECQPWVIRQHPALADWPGEGVTPSNWREYADRAVAALGETLELEPIPRDDHTRRDPIQELAEMLGLDKPIVVIDPEELHG